MLTPLLLLGVYTLVFGVIAPTRWPGAEDQGIGMFALRLLAGMVIHGLLSETLSRAPVLVTSQPNYVNKVVFPLETLAWVNLLAALFHSVMAMLVLILLNAVLGTGLDWTLLALPAIVLPYAVMLMGLIWLISALGVYLRDINQIIGPLITHLAPCTGPVVTLRTVTVLAAVMVPRPVR